MQRLSAAMRLQHRDRPGVMQMLNGGASIRGGLLLSVKQGSATGAKELLL